MCPGGEADKTSQAIAAAIAAARIKKAEPPPAVDASTRVNQPAPDNAVAATPAAPTAEPPPPIRPSAPSALPQRRAPTRAVTTGGGQVGTGGLQPKNVLIQDLLANPENLINDSVKAAEKELKRQMNEKNLSAYQLAAQTPRFYEAIKYLSEQHGDAIRRKMSNTNPFFNDGQVLELIAREYLLNRFTILHLVSQMPNIKPYEPKGSAKEQKEFLNSNVILTLPIYGSISMIGPGAFIGDKGAAEYLRVVSWRLLPGKNSWADMMNSGTYQAESAGFHIKGALRVGENVQCINDPSPDHRPPFDKEPMITFLNPTNIWILSGDSGSSSRVMDVLSQASQRANAASIRGPR